MTQKIFKAAAVPSGWPPTSCGFQTGFLVVSFGRVVWLSRTIDPASVVESPLERGEIGGCKSSNEWEDGRGQGDERTDGNHCKNGRMKWLCEKERI